MPCAALTAFARHNIDARTQWEDAVPLRHDLPWRSQFKLYHYRRLPLLARIAGVDARIKAQLVTKLEELAKNPAAMPGVKLVAGEWAGFYRLRRGGLRVIYLHDRANDTIVIAHVGPRGDVYK